MTASFLPGSPRARPRLETRALGLASLLALFVFAGPAGAQRRQPDTVLALDVDVLGGSLSYARATGPGRYWGVAAGVGGAFLSRMLLSGRHFAHEDGPSYQPRDGAVDKALFEILHAGVFRRWAPSDRFNADAGARASVFVHFDSSDDDPGIPLFVGLYGGAMVGGRRLKVGPRLLVGMFSEGSTAREFGVYFVPLSGRLSFGW
ncbi:MAG TPA: hypothetical protein VLA43_18255 [Longimicrobiales bacterium]|nr:hypothetical protein [Longimicrobiales bacterium]